MKILVLGHTGMAGHMITAYLGRQGHQVYTAGRNADPDFYLDVLNTASINNIFQKSLDFDYVINCIGLLVRPSQDRPDLAARINAWFPQYLAYLLHETTTKLIHISTDCVFSGKKGQYLESDPTDEENFYGRSKSLGEVVNNKDITFRTSIIGPERRGYTGLMDWFRHQSPGVVSGYTNAIWNGMTTLQLAKCLDIYMSSKSKTAGIYNLVNNHNKISKYYLLTMINRIFVCGKTIVPMSLNHTIDKTLVDTRQSLNWQIGDYEQQLTELRDFNPLTHVPPTSA